MADLELIAAVVIYTFVFIIGSSIGSFLNVVIYRVPIGLRVGEPKRSFCPACKAPIPWFRNLPILSWIALRGRCAECGIRISPRYLIVELLTGLLFLAVWRQFGLSAGELLRVLSGVPPSAEATLGDGLQILGRVLAYWIFVSLLVAATFIDFDHYIIPDSITLGGVGVGLLFGAALPLMMDAEGHLQSFFYALVGAAAGYGLLWSVVTLGKLAFGRINRQFDEPVPWSVRQEDGDDEPMIDIDGEVTPWTDVFFRPTDRMVVEVETLSFNRKPIETEKLVIYSDRFETGEQTFPLEDVEEVSGTCSAVVVPREAMGYGDVKFVAMFGAFLGWQSVLFALFAASIFGSIVGVGQKLVVRETWQKPIPFGPYLAFGAIVWLFAGPAVVSWYLELAGMRPR